MAAIDKLQQRPTFSTGLVQQAMQEARANPTVQQQLQQLVDQRAADFEDPGQVDHVHQLLAELCKDTFEVVPNRQAGAVGKPEVLEARITKVKDEAHRVDITPPPPPPPSYFRDPLNVTGKAPAGTVVEFYNASVPGRPSLGAVTADVQGQFSFELTDETKFAFGDQIGVRLVGADGAKGRPLIVPTEPFLITNIATTYFTRVSGTPQDVRTDHTTRRDTLDKKTDDRPPFFQGALVGRELTAPAVVEQPYLFKLTGKDDAVEPNATITVRVGNETFATKVDDQGQFALKVSGVIPGQRLAIEVRDLNGHGIDIPARVPPIGLLQASIAAGMVPDGDVVRVSAFSAVPPGGALIVRNASSGVVSELVADQHGKLDGVLKGIKPFDAFEIAVRDVNGHVSEEASLLVSLPANGSKKASVVLASSLDAAEPDLACAFRALAGPPVDVMVNGKAKPGGPFLPLPTLPKLPAHAVLEVVKDGAVVQALRADGDGRLDGMLRGVHVGDALSFRLKDAAGRQFPTTIDGFVVPNGKVLSTVRGVVAPRLAPLDATAIGTGGLAVDPAWLAPAKVLVGKAVPQDFQQRHAVTSQVGGAILAAPEAHFMAEHFADMPLKDGASLTVTQSQGQKTVGVDVTGVAGSPFSFGFDDVTGTLHGVSAAELPKMKTALQATLAMVGAAYAQGKEPGDVGYDRALGAAKTLMFLLDRFAVQNPTEAKAAQQVALDVLGTRPFRFDIAPRDVVGAARPLPIEAPTSQALNLLQARTLAMGAIGRSDPLRAATRGAVDTAALSSVASYDGKTLTVSGKGVVAAGDELLVKVGDTVHRFTADKAGALQGKVDVAPGTVIELAQRGADETTLDQRGLNPIVKAVVVQEAILGEGHVVGMDALVQRAPDARDVVKAVFDGTAVKGLPPGGSVVINDSGTITRVAIDAAGTLGKFKGAAIKNGDIVDVSVRDAAGRPFAPVVQGIVVGAAGETAKTGRAMLDTDALSLRSVIDQVGSGQLALPTFPKREGDYGPMPTSEAYAELKPFHGPSSTLEEQHGRFSTKAAFPPGLLPALAQGPEKRTLSMGDSVSMSAHQWDSGEINIGVGFYVENQRPDFKLRFDDKTGVVTDNATGKPLSVPDGLAKVTTLLQTSLAFVAVAQKVGSDPGDGFYDLAARTAKSTLVICDRLIAQHPTFRTEILAAVRAAVPTSMPFDLPPVGNASASAQTPPTDRVPERQLAFWNTVHHDDVMASSRQDRYRPRSVEMPVNNRPAVGGGGFFGGGSFFTAAGNKPATTSPAPGGQSTVPLYMRTLTR